MAPFIHYGRMMEIIIITITITFETLSVKLMEYLGTGGPESSEGSIAGRGEEEGDSPGE